MTPYIQTLPNGMAVIGLSSAFPAGSREISHSEYAYAVAAVSRGATVVDAGTHIEVQDPIPVLAPSQHPVFNRQQFNSLLRRTGWEIVWDTVAAYFKDAGDWQGYDALMTQRDNTNFYLEVTLAILAEYRPVVGSLGFTGVDLSDEAVTTHWYAIAAGA